MREKWLVMYSRLGPHSIQRGIGPGLHASTDLTPVGERSVWEGSTLHPASDHLPPRWAGLSWLCPRPPRHPPALPQGGERPTQCLPSWGLQGPQSPLLCPISRTLFPSCLNPTPVGPRRNVYSLAHHPFQGHHPSLVAPRVQGAPAAQGQPVHGGFAPRGLRDPGRRRGQGWRATHTLTCPPHHSCVLGWVSITQGHRVDTHRVHKQEWTCTGFRLVAPQGPAQLYPLPAHMLLMVWPEPPSRAHLVPGIGTQRKGVGSELSRVTSEGTRGTHYSGVPMDLGQGCGLTSSRTWLLSQVTTVLEPGRV